jgi:uncharacterized protein (TIGR00290 family)
VPRRKLTTHHKSNGIQVGEADEHMRLVSSRSGERPTRLKSALSWSGGKDSALTLWTLSSDLGLEPDALITTVTEHYDRVSMHGVRRSLLRRQADAVGIPLVEITIPPNCISELYEERMTEAFSRPPLQEVDEVAFGDLFLEDVRAYRESRLKAAGKSAAFPLWHRDTTQLARGFVDAGFDALLVCVDPSKLDPCFAGRPFDHRLLDELPASVDPCGENGEFHTFVRAGPIFPAPIPCQVGTVVMRGGFVFADIELTSFAEGVEESVS